MGRPRCGVGHRQCRPVCPCPLQVDRITARIHRLLAIPEPFGEAMYVLRYEANQEYRG